MAAENHPLLPTYVWGSQEPSACRQRLQHLGYFSLCRKAVFYTSTKQNKQTKKDEKDKKKPYLGSQTKRKLTHFGSLQCRYDLLCIKASTLFEKSQSKSPSHYLTSYRKNSEGESSCPQHDAHNEDRGPADVLGSCLKCATKNKCWSASGWFSDQWRAHLAGV